MQARVSDSAPASKSSMVTLRDSAEARRRTLRARVGGEVRFDNGSRALYATDGSNYRQVPIGVVIPRDADDVVATSCALPRIRRSACSAAAAAPLSPDNAATSPSSSIFRSTWQTILEIDPARRIARVQPGVVLDHLRATPPKNIISPLRPIPPPTTAAPSAA